MSILFSVYSQMSKDCENVEAVFRPETLRYMLLEQLPNIKMYYILLSIVLFFISPIDLFAQFWQKVESNNNGILKGIDFYDGMFGMIVIRNSLILQTTDGGNSWNNQEIGDLAVLNDISLISSTTAIAVGIEAIFKTTNGGNYWQRINTGSDTISSLLNINFANSTIGMAAGIAYPDTISQQGIILITLDAGETWQRRNNGIEHPLSCVWMIDSTTALASSYYYRGIYRTTNQGLSWEMVDSTIAADRFHFINKNYGWSVGWPMAKTTNGGLTWTKVALNVASPSSGIYVLDSLNIICLGNNGEIIRTTDAGTTWRVEHINLGFLSDIDCTGDNCFAVGVHGTILRSKRRVSAYDDPIPEHRGGNLNVRIYSSEIFIDVPYEGTMEANIYDILGKPITQLWNGDVHAERMSFHAFNFSSGIYFLHVKLYSQNSHNQIQAALPITIIK